jgi:DNA invertase Pin-like site-specific DNA recombinase
MPVMVGYIRETRYGHTYEEQHAALQDARVEKRLIWADRLKNQKALLAPVEQRDGAIKSLREGEILVVYGLDKLGTSLRDLADQIAKVAERGATVRDLLIQEELPDAATTVKAIEMALRAKHAYDTERLGPANAKRRAEGKMGGRPLSLANPNSDAVKAARLYWDDPHLSEKRAAQLAGYSVSTMRRHLKGRRTTASQ